MRSREEFGREHSAEAAKRDFVQKVRQDLDQALARVDSWFVETKLAEANPSLLAVADQMGDSKNKTLLEQINLVDGIKRKLHDLKEGLGLIDILAGEENAGLREWIFANLEHQIKALPNLIDQLKWKIPDMKIPEEIKPALEIVKESLEQFKKSTRE